MANVNGTLSYLVHDTLGSVSASLTASGGLQSAQLFAPYGAVRYSTGTMPTTYGFTGQRSDPSGLMYYHARYYDPSVGQFASADAVQGPNRYGYVAGNPETQTDPTGQRLVCDDDSATCNPHRSPGPQPVNPDPAPPAGGGGAGGGGGHLPTSCGTYTSQAQCDKAKDAQEAAVKDARKAAGVWQLLVGLATGAFDIMMLIRDLNSAKSDNPDKAVDIAKDIVGIVADLGVLLEGIGNAFAGLFGDSGFLQGLRQFGAKVVDVGNTARALDTSPESRSSMGVGPVSTLIPAFGRK